MIKVNTAIKANSLGVKKEIMKANEAIAAQRDAKKGSQGVIALFDLVHLFTRKQANGGVAWVDGICNNQYKYGVSSGLNTNLNVDYPDNTPFSYNMSYVGHEVGHNFGANHTHWCGWEADQSQNFSGGAIDSCYPVEGNCSEPGNPNINPQMHVLRH